MGAVGVVRAVDPRTAGMPTRVVVGAWIHSPTTR